LHGRPIKRVARPPQQGSPPWPRWGATLRHVEERYESELTRSAAVLDGVDRALERLNEGSYGTCEACGAPIAESDLEHEPTRHMCGQHLSRA